MDDSNIIGIRRPSPVTSKIKELLFPPETKARELVEVHKKIVAECAADDFGAHNAACDGIFYAGKTIDIGAIVAKSAKAISEQKDHALAMGVEEIES